MPDSPNQFAATNPQAPSPPIAAIPTVNYATPTPLAPNLAAKVSLLFAVLCLSLIGTSLLLLQNDARGAPLFMLSILALASGIRALKRTRSLQVAGAGLAIAVGVIGLVATMMIINTAIPSIGLSRETANRAKCLRNLKVIGDAIYLYANENHGLYPPNFEALMLSQDIFSDLFICPSSNDDHATGDTLEQRAANLSKGHCSYIYLGAGKNVNKTPANLVLAYEPLTNHNQAGMNVLFADTHVEFIPNPQAKK
jgi:prepilin-type processing-associated H-X9-DG protein